MKDKKSLVILLGIIVFISVCLLELKAIYWAGLDSARVFSWVNISAFGLFFLFCMLALLIVLTELLPGHAFLSWIKFLHTRGWMNRALQLALCFFPIWFFSFSAWGLVFRSPILHLWCFASMVIISNWLLIRNDRKLFSFRSTIQSILLVGTIFLIGDRFKEISDYPFSMYWSEGNRFWDYSLLFGKDRYLYPSNKPIFAYIDLGRQSLWGLPFIFKNIGISAMRAWNVLLFTATYILLGLLVFRKKTSLPTTLLLGLWTFLFLNQGPIYTPLILCAMLVWVAGGAPLLISLILLTIAGYYANLTRYTWSIAPAIWGVLLALFYKDKDKTVKTQIDWLRVVTSGMAGLFGGLILPIIAPLSTSGATQEFQGAIVSSAASTLQSQTLIWSRLLPNETYAPGIVLGILFAAIPLIILLAAFSRQTKLKINLWQQLATIGSCLAFLMVGLIASIKVGGGSNLHNLDMLFINFLFLAGIAWQSGGREWLLKFNPQKPVVYLSLLFMVIYPLFPTITSAYPFDPPSKNDQRNVLAFIQKSVSEAKNIGEVLFIDQRQLLTFGEVKGVALVPEYEKKFIMDRAMSGDEALFIKFYQDLQNHRFSLIINEPAYIEHQFEDASFGTENDVWVEWIAKPTLCYYRILQTYKNPSVELLIPRVMPPDESCRKYE
jgi:hypothetical protein